METVVRLSVAGLLLTSVAFGAIDFQVDSDIGFDFIEDRCVLFDAASTGKLARGRLELNLRGG